MFSRVGSITLAQPIELFEASNVLGNLFGVYAFRLNDRCLLIRDRAVHTFGLRTAIDTVAVRILADRSMQVLRVATTRPNRIFACAGANGILEAQEMTLVRDLTVGMIIGVSAWTATSPKTP